MSNLHLVAGYHPTNDVGLSSRLVSSRRDSTNRIATRVIALHHQHIHVCEIRVDFCNVTTLEDGAPSLEVDIPVCPGCWVEERQEVKSEHSFWNPI
jgi:hypothetical protein